MEEDNWLHKLSSDLHTKRIRTPQKMVKNKEMNVFWDRYKHNTVYVKEKIIE